MEIEEQLNHYMKLLQDRGVPNIMTRSVANLMVLLTLDQYNEGFREGMKAGVAASQPKQESWSKYNAG